MNPTKKIQLLKETISQLRKDTPKISPLKTIDPIETHEQHSFEQLDLPPKIPPKDSDFEKVNYPDEELQIYPDSVTDIANSGKPGKNSKKVSHETNLKKHISPKVSSETNSTKHPSTKNPIFSTCNCKLKPEDSDPEVYSLTRFSWRVQAERILNKTKFDQQKYSFISDTKLHDVLYDFMRHVDTDNSYEPTDKHTETIITKHLGRIPKAHFKSLISLLLEFIPHYLEELRKLKEIYERKPRRRKRNGEIHS